MDKVELKVALAEMRDEINDAKGDAEDFQKGLDDVQPDDLTYDEGTEDAEGEDLTEDDKEKAKVIKTPEDAKKVLDEAKKDIEDVIDNLDGLLGQTEEEEKTASIKRISSKYTGSLSSLGTKVDKALADAQQAMRHWSYLLKVQHPKISSIKDASLKKAAQSIEDIGKVKKLLDKLFHTGKKTEATAVPPSGAELIGGPSMWPPEGNPAMTENRAWEAGAGKFDKDKKFEDARPNPAVDERLTDVEYKHDPKPFVNARFIALQNNKFGSGWDVLDTKSGKRMFASFAQLPQSIADTKDEKNFSLFSSKQYGYQIQNHIKMDGIDKVARELNAKISKLEPTALRTFAADKGSLKSYYTDAYGSGEYASKLVSGGDNTDGGMKEDYKPEYEHVKDNKQQTKDGPGKMSSKIEKLQKKILRTSRKLSYFQKTASTAVDENGVLFIDKFAKKLKKQREKLAHLKGDSDGGSRAVLKAKAENVIQVARKFAAAGAIPFTQAAIYEKGKELMKLSDEAFAVTASTIDKMPIWNEAALKESHIPDTEKGIVGNKSQGVSDPKAEVKTEDMNPATKADAKISKQASVVPQISTSPQQSNAFTPVFNTTVNRLERLGISTNKLHQPKYRQS
jgi:hypothetical protein